MPKSQTIMGEQLTLCSVFSFMKSGGGPEDTLRFHPSLFYLEGRISVYRVSLGDSCFHFTS